MIKLWENKVLGCPSIQVGNLTLDDPPQHLFDMIVQHPDAILANEITIPSNPQITQLLLNVVTQEITNSTSDT